MKKSFLLALASSILLSACVTGPQSSVASSLSRLGLSKERSSCVAREMDNRLDRGDLRDVAQFLEGLNGSRSAGNVLDTLLTIDNPRAATAFARAGISCAF